MPGPGTRSAQARPLASIVAPHDLVVAPHDLVVDPRLDAGGGGPPTLVRASRRRTGGASLPMELQRRFEAVVFDWDGTAVADRRADASDLRAMVEGLTAAGVDLVVVSGTNVDNVDGQLHARPDGPGELHLCLDRGSQVFAVDRTGPHLVQRRTASSDEDALLSAAAELTVARLARRGFVAEIVAQRLNRRKVDLMPLPAWSDPPKARIGDLVAAVEQRLHTAGIATLAEVIEIATAAAQDIGLPDPRVTSDAKHVEIGLTDKSDSARWAFDHLWQRGIGAGLVLIVGDEFGPLGGVSGSDSMMLVPRAASATVASVGVEPGGLPATVSAVAGGPAGFRRILRDQLQRRARQAVPEIDRSPGWTIPVIGFDVETERTQESLLNLAAGGLGMAGAPLDDHPALSPRVLAAGAYTDDGPDTSLLGGPLCDRSGSPFVAGARLTRTLDLRTGVLAEEVSHRGASRRALRFASLARPGTVALRTAGHRRLMPVGPPLVAPDGAVTTCSVDLEGRSTMSVAAGDTRIVAAADETRLADRSRGRLDRLATYRVEPVAAPVTDDAVRALARSRGDGIRPAPGGAARGLGGPVGGRRYPDRG